MTKLKPAAALAPFPSLDLLTRGLPVTVWTAPAKVTLTSSNYDDYLKGTGVLLYLSQEGRGIGLLNKLRAYKLQEGGMDTVEANLQLGLPADLRDYGIGAQILVDLGLSSIRILTNNPKKIRGLEGYGLSVTDQVPIQHEPNPHNEAYLNAKRDRLGHTLHHQALPLDEQMIHEEHVRDRKKKREEGG